MTEVVVSQDIEWKSDWELIREVFDHIDSLKATFEKFNVSYLREIQQRILVLNLEKYAWSLQNYIIEKYSNPR